MSRKESKESASGDPVLAPKLFISYSWTSPAHEQWVLELAEELVRSGVEVILDKWELREGHDANAFMEAMVADATIRKVAMICDRRYVEKSNDRTGGVGIETQIISKKVYEELKQRKFVAITLDDDDNGNALVPHYYGSKIHIDFRDSSAYADSFEKLIRWVFDKPLYVKPTLGIAPAYILDSSIAVPRSKVLLSRVADSIRNGKPGANGLLREFLLTFSDDLEAYRISASTDDNFFDDQIITSIKSFDGARAGLLQTLHMVAQYDVTDETVNIIHRFIEELIGYFGNKNGITERTDWDFDNYKFIVHEIFLYTVAYFIRYDRFAQTRRLFINPYYTPSRYGEERVLSFWSIRQHMKSLIARNDRLKAGRASLRADMLKERVSGTGITFNEIMQADFVVFLAAELSQGSDWGRWWPETLVYASHVGPFEIFARSVSASYFNRMKVLFGVEIKEDFLPLLNSYRDQSRRLPSWSYERLEPASLMGYERIASIP